MPRFIGALLRYYDRPEEKDEDTAFTLLDAIRYLREKELSTVQSLDAYLDTVSGQAVSIRAEMKPKEQRMKEATGTVCRRPSGRAGRL